MATKQKIHRIHFHALFTARVLTPKWPKWLHRELDSTELVCFGCRCMPLIFVEHLFNNKSCCWMLLIFCISYYSTAGLGQSQKDSVSTSHDSAGQSRPSLYSSVSQPLGVCEV